MSIERRCPYPVGHDWYRRYREIYKALAASRDATWRALVKVATLIWLERQVGVPRVGEVLVLSYLEHFPSSPDALDLAGRRLWVWEQASHHCPGVEAETHWRRLACEEQAKRAFLALDFLWQTLEPEWDRSLPIPTKFVDTVVELGWELYEGRFSTKPELLGRLTESRLTKPRATGRYRWGSWGD